MKNIQKSSLIIFFLLAFLAGVALANFFVLPIIYLVIILIVGFFLALRFRKNKKVILNILIILGALIGMLRFELARHEANQSDLDYYNDIEQRVSVTGIIAEEPDRRADHAKYTLEVSELKVDGQVKVVEGRILIKISKLPEYFYGDELQLTGNLQTPFEEEEFSYRDYLARYDIYSVMYRPRAWKISADHGSMFFKLLYDFKKTFEDKINQVFPEPQASFMAGLLIGSRKGIPPDITEEFNITGLTHIVAISGYNIALVIALVTGFFGSLVPRKWQFPLAGIFVVSFTLLVGANAAVVRAAIMGLLAFYALTVGRQYHVSLALVMTASVMIFWNSQILINDVSFQLSFAAVAGLMYVSPIFEKWAQKIPDKFAIRESLIMTMSAQVTAVPLIVFYFARLSLVAPLANVLVAPAIPLAMLLGFIATAIGFVFLPLGILIGFGAHILLSYILWVAKTLAYVPLASLEVGWFSVGVAVIYYAGLIFVLARRKLKEP